MTHNDAYTAYLAAIDAERMAIDAFLAADDAKPFDRDAFDACLSAWNKAQQYVRTARIEWYAAIGNAHNPEQTRL